PGCSVLLSTPWGGPIAATSLAVLAQPGACASSTCTLLRAASPVLVTLIVQVAVPGLRIVCECGSFEIEMPGLITFSTSQLLCELLFRPVPVKNNSQSSCE